MDIDVTSLTIVPVEKMLDQITQQVPVEMLDQITSIVLHGDTDV